MLILEPHFLYYAFCINSQSIWYHFGISVVSVFVIFNLFLNTILAYLCIHKLWKQYLKGANGDNDIFVRESYNNSSICIKWHYHIVFLIDSLSSFTCMVVSFLDSIIIILIFFIILSFPFLGTPQITTEG